MEKAEFRRNADDMIYLTICAIKGIVPEQKRIEKLNLPELFEVCQRHILTACVAYALESAGIKDNAFTQAKEKAIRKNILLDAERGNITKRLEAEHIWYMPLKGALLKDWYPKLGMRQMSDNDILCDSEKRADVKEIMLELGFTCQHYGKFNDDEYFKQPVSNFEMHYELFTNAAVGKLHDYYDDVKTRLIRDDNKEYGYRFTDEDYYIYLTAHEFKHYYEGGTGVRSLIDAYVYLSKFRDSLDWNYISEELRKLEMFDYEHKSRELAMKLFEMKQLTPEEDELLDYYIMSGTYGNVENRVKNEMELHGGGSKFGFVRFRLFPPLSFLEESVPWVRKSRLLIPAAYIFRLFRASTSSRKAVSSELKQLKKKQ